MHRIQISNKIFDQGLSVAAISVYAYLCSIKGNVCNGFTHVKVKQKTIAAACGIASVQTVAKAIRELTEKQIIMQSIRTVRCDRSLSTNIYVFKKLPTTDGFFFVSPDMAFSGQLVPRQIVVYLFLCKAHSARYGCSWNSYNDMATQLHMKRETVIATIQELCTMQLVVKQRRRSRENNRVYVDNRYFIVQRVRGAIKKKKSVWETDFFAWLTKCQVFVNVSTMKVYHERSSLSSLFYKRGSPQIEIRILNPRIYSARKRKNKAILSVYCKSILYGKLKILTKAFLDSPLHRHYITSVRRGLGGGAVWAAARSGRRRGFIFLFLVATPEVSHEESEDSPSWRVNSSPISAIFYHAFHCKIGGKNATSKCYAVVLHDAVRCHFISGKMACVHGFRCGVFHADQSAQIRICDASLCLRFAAAFGSLPDGR